ncbi:YbaB/EbfC family nucleoid-associated protein [Candidatus Uhrbacteria bacterium]|jgi:DNA-binding protein YbaB|nr:YbaB/EbfC family nucleoid-associated protein [Candidatus Uhrbacteria bacterium]
MFNKIKALKDVRSQAKTIEKALEAVQVTGSSNGVEIKMNGKQEVLSVTIEEGKSTSEIERGVKGALEEVNKKLQKEIQAAMKEAGGMPDLSQLGL